MVVESAGLVAGGEGVVVRLAALRSGGFGRSLLEGYRGEPEDTQLRMYVYIYTLSELRFIIFYTLSYILKKKKEEERKNKNPSDPTHLERLFRYGNGIYVACYSHLVSPWGGTIVPTGALSTQMQRVIFC